MATLNLIKALLTMFRDLILIIFGGKNMRHFVFKVPQYCRYKCDYVFICRDIDKEWKTRKGCLILNYDFFTEREEKFYNCKRAAQCERIIKEYKKLKK